MVPVMWIELIARDGGVALRQRIDGDEARIGRAFDNDLVVDDPHVAPHHLRVYRGADGELVAEDLGTLNGLYTEHGARRLRSLSLAREPVIRIGRTTLRVHDGAQEVAPERLLTPPGRHVRWDAALAVALFSAVLLGNWLNLTGEPNANALVLPLLGLATILVTWSGVWALLSRIFVGQSLFALHLRIALSASIALVAWAQVAEIAAYALAWREMSEYAGLGAWAVLAATCYAHLHAMGPRHMRMATGVLMALIVAGASLQYFQKWAGRTENGQRVTLGDLKPPVLRAVPLETPDDFFKRTAEVKARVDAARVKEPPPGALSDSD